MIRFDDRLRAELAANLDAHERRVKPLDGRRHAGQWAFPGGRVEVGESPLEATLRELDEELGLRLGPDAVIGWLDDYPTRSGYVITPVVLWGGSDPTLNPAHDEVLGAYRISLEVPVDELEQPVFAWS